MSKLINCKSCNTQIASNAKSCPSCGAKNKKPFYKRGWFIALVIVVLIIAISDSEDNDTTTATNATTNQEEQVSNEKDNTTKDTVETAKEKEESKTEVSYESVKELAKTLLEENFGKNGEIQVYENDGIVLFSVPSPEGIVEGVFAINSGMANDELIESYEYMKESFVGLSKELYTVGEMCGMKFALGLQNNKNPDNLLLTILNGTVVSEVAEY